MMNNLPWLKISPDMFLHNKTMVVDILILVSKWVCGGKNCLVSIITSNYSRLEVSLTNFYFSFLFMFITPLKSKSYWQHSFKTFFRAVFTKTHFDPVKFSIKFLAANNTVFSNSIFSTHKLIIPQGV